MELKDGGWVERWAGVDVYCLRLLAAIRWWRVDGRGWSSSGQVRSETSEDFCDVAWHGEGDGTVCGIEGDGEAEVMLAGPIDFDLVELTQRANEVVCIGFGAVFDAKIIDDESECDGVSFLAE